MAELLTSFLSRLTEFGAAHPYLAGAIGLAVILLMGFRPKAMLKLAGMVIVMAVAAYFFTLAVDMAGAGRAQKRTIIETRP